MQRAIQWMAMTWCAGLIASAQTPDLSRPGPWDNDVLVLRASTDGRSEKLATFARAGVPTVARMNEGRLIAAHQHFPENDRENFDKVVVHFSNDEGKIWSAAQVIVVKGLPEGMRFPFDPTLVPLPDGRVRLYFTGNYGRTFQNSTPAIHSAISTDGVNYTYETGVRFAVEGRAVIDCAVALHDGVFHLFAPDNGAGPNPGAPRDNRSAADRPRQGVGYHATSKDGLNFTRVEDVEASSNNRWLGAAVSDGGQLMFFGTGPGPWPLVSRDGIAWKSDSTVVRYTGADPGAVKLKDDSWLIVATGGPRPGTVSATQGGQRQFQPQGAPRGPDGGGFRQPTPPLMAALDKNSDGTIDAEELSAASASLKTLDRDGNGRLTSEELRPQPGADRPPRGQ